MALRPSNRKKVKPELMVQVNGETGKAEKIMQGGERIYSKLHTSGIIQRVLAIQTNKDREQLGRYVAGIIKKQDAQKPEYTKE